MFDPFKRARKKVTNKLRKTAVSTMTDAWQAVLGPAKSAKRKVTKKASAPATASTRQVKSKKFISKAVNFASGKFDSAHGARSFKIYVPVTAGKSEAPLPLIVMLHGCGQSAADFARDTGMNALAEEFGFVVLYPAQSRDAHLHRCWNWYKPEHQMRGAGEPALIACMTQHIIANHNIDPSKVYVVGLSAGAAASLVVATCYPDIFAAVGAHSGLAVGAAHSAASVAGAMQAGSPGDRYDVQMPTIMFHGDQDNVVNPRNGRYIAIRAQAPYSGLDRTERKGRIAGGREFTRILHRIGKGRPYIEEWVIHGSGHAWSGGRQGGSFTDPAGPDASREMVRFFLRHRTTKARRSKPL
ncbi:extracellular catalytic domain type 1 short-chain-length polyhydroxyalkanoate depolymerase [Yoonia sp. MH D7]